MESNDYNDKNTLISESDVHGLLNFEEKVENINIYRRAFVHKSYCTRKNVNFYEGNTHCPEGTLPLQEGSNERMEFLGDAILHNVIAKYLYSRYPNNDEGWLTNMRIKLVNGKMLTHLAKAIHIDKFIIISKQMENKNGRTNDKILEDTFESFIAAILLDYDKRNINGYKLGYSYAEKWIINVIEEHVDFAKILLDNTNYKDKLTKYCQYTYQYIPKFFERNVQNTNDGKIYTIVVKNKQGTVIGIGKDKTKKGAEVNAAKKALEYFDIID